MSICPLARLVCSWPLRKLGNEYKIWIWNMNMKYVITLFTRCVFFRACLRSSMKLLENPLNKPEKNTCVHTDRLPLSLENYILVIYFVCFGDRGLTRVPRHASRGQREACLTQFSPSMWVLGLGLSWAVLVQGATILWAISLAPVHLLISTTNLKKMATALGFSHIFKQR